MHGTAILTRPNSKIKEDTAVEAAEDTITEAEEMEAVEAQDTVEVVVSKVAEEAVAVVDITIPAAVVEVATRMTKETEAKATIINKTGAKVTTTRLRNTTNRGTPFNSVPHLNSHVNKLLQPILLLGAMEVVIISDLPEEPKLQQLRRVLMLRADAGDLRTASRCSGA